VASDDRNQLGRLAAAWLGERARVLETLLFDLEGVLRRSTVHDVRVACRRLRETLRFFAPELPETRDLDRLARRLMRVLGPLRERDVAMRHLRRFAGKTGRDVRRRLDQERTRIATRERKRTRKRAAALRRRLTLVGQHLPRVPWRHVGPWTEGGRALVEARIAERRRRAAALAAALSERPRLKDLHRLRIALKRWRYGAELGRVALPGTAATARQAAQLRRLLVLGGHCQDMDDLAGLVEARKGSRALRKLVRAARKQAAHEFAEAVRHSPALRATTTRAGTRRRPRAR